MTATVLLCILSTLSFCLCARGLVVLASGQGSVPRFGRKNGFSARAWRVARLYVSFALGCLALVSLVGAAFSYFELFNSTL